MQRHTRHLGDIVLCDLCGADYTFSTEPGGILFGSKAVCPTCAPDILESARKYSETRYIHDRCPEDRSFADWVRHDLRGGKPGTITYITGGDDV